MRILVYIPLDICIDYIEYSNYMCYIHIAYYSIFNNLKDIEFTNNLNEFLNQMESIKISTKKDIVCDFYYDEDDQFIFGKLANFIEQNKY